MSRPVDSAALGPDVADVFTAEELWMLYGVIWPEVTRREREEFEYQRMMNVAALATHNAPGWRSLAAKVRLQIERKAPRWSSLTEKPAAACKRDVKIKEATVTVRELAAAIAALPPEAQVFAEVGNLFGKYVVPAGEYDHVSGPVFGVERCDYTDPWTARRVIAVRLKAEEVVVG